ncbi:disintegrin and metalloproteinase domain-containing protein 5-like [Hippopotamus amphibius kiboko]|uniref:disintegrin and metalloproteinase domain-containing protein 5-like n=1 Tax=Hippopotamus amphibius kiboko TaxID=575201 RepID=UPI00259A6CBE|nr:disintegrin and metalloproteinase domain-containing protein 5-like [Hippopotamus amphibius kiboko]
MFLLLALLSGLRGLHGGPNHQKTFLQTTVPEKISTSEAIKDPENNVAYIIAIEGKPYFVHLKKQSFLSSASVVYYYDKDDTQHSQPLLAQMDCNYHGYIAGFPNSLVSLNICSGLRGTLQFKNISYGIEPVEAVSGFMHMIYEEKNDITNIPPLLENDTYSSESSRYQVRKSSEKPVYFQLFPRYLDMYIVVDKNLFDYMSSDIKAVTQKVIRIIGFVNTMLTQLKLTVRISSIDIWSNKNKVSTVGHPNHVLYRFIEWKYESLSHPHHTAYLFAFRKTPTFIGATTPGKICDKNFAAGFALYSEGLSLESYAVSIVQLLGLNVGMSYDNPEICHCLGDVCTMSPEAVHSGGIRDFSTCSLDDFKYFAAHSGIECLHKILPDEPVYKQKKVCGNGILESGEQCDCGTLLNCTHPNCCNPASCTKKKNKLCGSGACCTQDCKVKPVNTPCREPVDECDFLEFCNGNNSQCVPDTFARDGQRCDSGDSFCYGGRCRSFTRQCKQLIGGASRGAPFACFDEINSRGDKFGNCGRNYCDYPHMLCGKLVCVWPHKTLVSRANLSVIYTHVRDDICASTFLNTERVPRDTLSTFEDAGDRDETFVADGSVCGPDMYCVKFKCVEVKYQINSTLCDSARDCNSHGICNNFNHCHCKMGFAPPQCKPLAGDFGSIDDGHRGKVGKKLLRGRSLSHPKHRFQLIFFISLPVFIITAAVIIIKQSKIRELCYRGEPESDRSVSEESSSNSKLSPSVSSNVYPIYSNLNAEKGLNQEKVLLPEGIMLSPGNKAVMPLIEIKTAA